MVHAGTGDARDVAGQFAQAIALILRQRRRAYQRLRSRRRSLAISHRKHARQPFTPFTQMAAHQPETPQRSGQQDSGFSVAIFRSLPQRGADIIVIKFQPIQPYLLVCARQLRFGVFGKIEKKFCARLPDCFRLAARFELFKPILLDRLEHCGVA